MNEHLNVFIPYSQGNPNENNISRGLAILLNGDALIRERFIDELNVKLMKEGGYIIEKPKTSEEFDIDIQASASTISSEGLEGVGRIVPVTLTPEESPSEESNGGSNNTIPDIIIRCGENLIIVEVKRWGNYAHAQALHQAETILEQNKELELQMSPVIHLKWEDVVRLMQDVQALGAYGKNIVLNDYLDFLYYNCPSWFPVELEPFRQNMTDSRVIWKRIKTLALNSIAILGSGKLREDNDSYVVVNNAWCYTSGFHLLPVGVLPASSFDRLRILIWLGRDNSQSNYLFTTSRVKDNMDWSLKTKIDAGGYELEMKVYPYMKLAHENKEWAGVAWPSIGLFGTDRAEIRKKFFEPLAGRWHMEEWPEMKELFAQCGIKPRYYSIKDKGVDYFDVSVGYQIGIDIPLDALAELDGHTDFANGANDKAADLVVKAFQELRRMIEN